MRIGETVRVLHSGGAVQWIGQLLEVRGSRARVWRKGFRHGDWASLDLVTPLMGKAS